MNKKAILTLYKREMLDIIRDKKTVFMNIFVPIILYPLITIIASQVMMSVQTSLNEQTYQIAIIANEETSNKLQNLLSATLVDSADTKDSSDASEKEAPSNSDLENKNLSEKKSGTENAKEPFEKNNADPAQKNPGDPFSSDDENLRIEILKSDDPEEDLKNKTIHAYIEAALSDTSKKPVYRINYLASNVNSSTVANYIEKRLIDHREELRVEELKKLHVEYDRIWNPIEIEQTDHSTREQSVGSVLGGIIPLLMIMGLVNGASNTAIDTTAGEKERGTLETTFSFPVTRKEIITAKFSAVATMASISVLLNFLSIGVMGTYMYSLINSLSATDSEISVNVASFLPAVFIMLLCVILFAIFVSAISLALYSNAQSIKEAGLYATPIMLGSVFISYIGFIPNLELSINTAMLPVVNVVLLIKSILIFEYDIPMILLALVSNLAYGFLAVSLMYNVFEREDILFNEESRFLRIFESRANIKAGGTPTVGEAIFLLLIGLMGMIYIGTYFQLKFGFWGITSIQIIIFILAVGYALYAKFDLKKVFSLKMPSASHVFGSILLWIGTLILVASLSVLLQKIFPDSLKDIELMEDMLKGQSLPALVLVVAIAPAICEEILFRGFVFSAFRKKFNPYVAMLFVSILFGIYHMSLIKFFTTAILGFAINYSLYKSGSLATASLMHFLNNGISVLALYYYDTMQKLSQTDITPEMAEAEMMSQFNPIIAISIMLLFIISGVLLLNVKSKSSGRSEERS